MLRIRRPATLQGEIRPPSDKSMTHRAFMLGACASESTYIRNPLLGEDCLSTLECLAKMGLRYSRQDNGISLVPEPDWIEPSSVLDCGNSGTTMRLLSGLIASRPISATLIGDESLSRRPMRRVVEPLRLMGARIEGEHAPLRIEGGELHGINYISPVASAQIKSCLLLAGLRARGATTVEEPSLSRDHTERMLVSTGVEIERQGNTVSILGGQVPKGFEFSVPADISSASFWMVAAAIVPGSSITLLDVGINPTRSGILSIFEESGLRFAVLGERKELGEPVADILVEEGGIGMPFEISSGLVPRLIDEIPILCVLATQLDGTSVIRGAAELRVKESDRIEAVASGLKVMGANVDVFEDGLAIHGPAKLVGATIDAGLDHRIAMAFAIAGLIAQGETVIQGWESVRTSYPNFGEHLHRLCVW